MQNILFAGGDSDTDILDTEADMDAWFKEPVLYEGLIVSRSAAFQLCAEQTRCWAQMDVINDLEAVELRPGTEVLSAAAAYSHIFTRDHYRSFGRDV